ncbi:MAG TPA: helix-turn-helix transcriptional regulator [Candidatus Acidoferrales bacterium]|nr:helix-turn-helix transcriptional regulator [Candidatus Acidoferrales bacterium]
MDVPLVIRQRLEELGLEQRDLAAAAEVTESYISQLLTRKKAPPAPDRTDIYDKMGKFLKLPSGQLSKLADIQLKEELRKKLADPPAPLFREVRGLILRKCAPNKEKQVRAIFEKQPFGELERLVTQKLLDVVKRVAKEELESENWLHLVARLSGRSYEQTRVIILEFLDTDVFNVSIENCVSFLDPLIESWDIDLATFGMEIVLNRRLAPGSPKEFEFVEKEPDQPEEEPGLKEFLRDPSLSGDATEEEIEFLKKLTFKGKRPTPLYYYRELQNLRDPLHFRALMTQTPRKETLGQSQPDGSVAPMHKYLEANGIEKQLQLDARKRAIQRWAGNKGTRGKKQKANSIRVGKTLPTGRS